MEAATTGATTTSRIDSNDATLLVNSTYHDGGVDGSLLTCTTEIVQPPTSKRREICIRCERPQRATCICSALPTVKIQLKSTYCIILQHPNECKQHQNRTVPFIEHCIDSNSYLKIVGRRFPSLLNRDIHPIDLAHHNHDTKQRQPSTNEDSQLSYIRCMNSLTQQPPTSTTTIWLLSSNDTDNTSITLTEALEEWEEQKRQHHHLIHHHTSSSSNNTATTIGTTVANTPTPKIVLLVLDATWKYANEMDRANIQHQCYPNSNNNNKSKHASTMRRVRLTAVDFHHTLFQQQQQQQQCFDGNNVTTTNHCDISKSIHRFAIRTPPKSKSSTTNPGNNNNSIIHLSTAECVAYVLTRIEQNDTIYHTIMKPLDLMVQQWQSHYKTHP